MLAAIASFHINALCNARWKIQKDNEQATEMRRISQHTEQDTSSESTNKAQSLNRPLTHLRSQHT